MNLFLSGPFEGFSSVHVKETDDSVTSLQVYEDIQAEGTGTVLWDASVAACYLLSRRDLGDWKGKRVLELGAGLGLPSIYLALKGALCTITDFTAVCLNLIQKNIEKNCTDAEVDIDIVCLDWAAPSVKGPFSLIICSDLLYDTPDFTVLINCLLTLADEQTTILVVYRHRRSGEDYFFEQIQGLFESADLPLNAKWRQYVTVDSFRPSSGPQKQLPVDACVLRKLPLTYCDDLTCWAYARFCSLHAPSASEK